MAVRSHFYVIGCLAVDDYFCAMKTLVDMDTWIRRDHFQFFSKFDEPFFGVTVSIDCTKAYSQAKEKGLSFFQYYLFRTLVAVNEIENFRYRIVDDKAWLYDQVNVSPTINRPDGSFAFGYIDFTDDEQAFYYAAQTEILRVMESKGLQPSGPDINYLHFSALPWLNFTSLSHARNYRYPDSCPKISVGQMTVQTGIRSMPVSIHVHHGLADGIHVGQFVKRFQELMND